MKTRDQINKEDKWSVSEIYKDEKEIEKTKEEINNNVKEIVSHKNKIGENSETLFKVLKMYYQMESKIETLYIYFSHTLDEDHQNSDNMGKMMMMQTFLDEINANLSFLTPELSQISEEKYKLYLEENKDLREFENQIEEIIREKKYVLSKQEEHIMSLASPLVSLPSDIYSTFTNSELTFEDIKDKDGNVVQFSEAKWQEISQSNDQILRENGFKSLLNGYKKFNLTITQIFLGYLNTKVFSIKARGYDNPRQRALFNNKIDEKIYDNLVNSGNNNITTNHQYLNLRKEILGYKELNLYDVYVPLLEEGSKKY
jgi:oligoendopeptidase F